MGWFKKLSSLALCLALALSLACSSKPKRSHSLAPLVAPAWRTSLEVKGFGPATLAVPLGATTARPIVVVLHGERDRPEWQCGTFRGLLGGRVFILCPQGKPLAGAEAGFGLGSVEESVSELRAALGALKARYGAHVAPSPIVLVGYGDGATVAADLARQEPSFFARVASINGNPAAFSSSAAKIFGERGGKRVLFFCTNANCDERATARALQLTRFGAQAKAVRREVGPYLDPRFVAALAPEIAWLLEGDPRFR